MSEGLMMKRFLAPALVLLLMPLAVQGATPPEVDHQPALCTLPDEAISLCAAVSDDGTVAANSRPPYPLSSSPMYFAECSERVWQFFDGSR